MLAGVWVSTPQGKHLARRKSKNTQPEIALRSAIHKQGGRFRLHRRLAVGCTPDLVLPRYRIAIFVDGCFWHGCPEHGRKVPWSGPNANLWREKLERTRARDARSSQIAADLGWQVLRVWECAVLKDPDGLATEVLGAGQSRDP